jgi:cytidyltransferase-like protein
MKRTQSRIGIYSGTFDPVHAGHMAFALQAMQEAKLDRLYFLPERRPRYKQGVEHFAHRVAMLERAILKNQALSKKKLPVGLSSRKRSKWWLAMLQMSPQVVFVKRFAVVNLSVDFYKVWLAIVTDIGSTSHSAKCSIFDYQFC